MAKRSIIALANEKVPFPRAAQWAGVEVYAEPGDRGVKARCPFGLAEHDDGGDEPALRVYADHGFCFACSTPGRGYGRYFTTVSLLAEAWQLDRQDAAAEALRRAGHVPASYAHLFAEADRDPEPDREALAEALLVFCSAVPGWADRSTADLAVRTQLASCLGLLPLVRTAQECEAWLSAAKAAMSRVLPTVN